MSKPTLKHWKIQSDKNICCLLIDVKDSAQNILTQEVLKEFSEAIKYVDEQPFAGLIITSAKKNSFIAGADINEFTKVTSPEEASSILDNAHKIFDRLESLPIPTVAAINGYCLGGGMELALACRYRIVLDNPSIRVGLPEVQLGIHPGFGGTLRCIKRLGALNALPIMIAGSAIDSRRAKKIGLIDQIAPARHFMAVATKMAISKPKTKSKYTSFSHSIQSTTPIRKLISYRIRSTLNKRVNIDHYPAPFALLDLWQQHGGNQQEMLSQEKKSVAKLLPSKTAQNLIKLFFLKEKLKKTINTTNKTPVKHVHVIGAGVMGGDIAAWCALCGLTVTLSDSQPEALGRAIQRAHKLFKRKIKVPSLVTKALDRLRPDIDGHGAKNADLVIEAIVEDLDAKIALFSALEKQVKPNTILATNTSGIPLEHIAKKLKKPGRLVGIHFFNPVAQMQLIEIVRAKTTYSTSVQAALHFTKQIKKLSIVVKSTPGFLVNRILMPYLLEAVELAHEGVELNDIDVIAEKFGMPMGPITLSDTVGLDVCFAVAKNLTDETNSAVLKFLESYIQKGDLGKKTGQGFYNWKKPRGRSKQKIEQLSNYNEIQERLILRYLNESVACLAEGVIESSEHLNGGMVFGTGFAPHLGGPMSYIEETGASVIKEKLKSFQVKYGDRFKPHAGWDNLV